MSEASSKRRSRPTPERAPRRRGSKRPAERARAAESHAADGRIAEILESIDDAFYALDRGWRFTYVNARACELWGVSREAVLGRPAADVFPAWTGSESHEAHRRAAAEGQPVRIETMSAVLGRPIELNVFPSASGLSVHVRDLSGLRRAEAERQAILDAMAQGLAVFDRNGEVMYRNAAARAILGIASDREVPSYIGADHPMAPRRRDGAPLPRDDHPAAHALRGETIRGDEIRLTRASDGQEIVCRYDAVPLRDPAGAIVGAILTFQDITAQKEAEERQSLLMAELDHRVKNILALVQAVAQQSLRGKPRDVDVFNGRLVALGRTHSLLAQSSWKGVSLRALVLDALAPYGEDGAERFAIGGPGLLLKPKPAQSLGMALHELATNAAKYGALSRPGGHVRIAWTIADGPDAPRLRLCWIESGGPPVSKPARRGFGSTVIERSLTYQLGGTVRLEFRRPGVHCAIELPFTPGTGRRQDSDEKTAPA